MKQIGLGAAMFGNDANMTLSANIDENTCSKNDAHSNERKSHVL